MCENSTLQTFKLKRFYLPFVLICISPFIYIASYNLPLSDEFTAMHYRTMLGYIGYEKLLFNTWSGRYTANLLEIIYPLKINYLFYQIIPLILIILFFLSLFLISKKTLGKHSLLFSSGMLILILNYSPAIADLIYYVPAIIIYTVSFLSVLFLFYIWSLDIDEKYKMMAFILNNIILLGAVEFYIPVVLYFSFILLIKSILNKKFILFYLLNQLLTLLILYYLLNEKGNVQRFSGQQEKFDLLSCTYYYIFPLFFWTRKFLLLIPFVLLLTYAIPGDILARLSKKITYRHLTGIIIGYLLLFSPLFMIHLDTHYKRISNVFFFYFLIMSVPFSIKLISRLNLSVKKINGLLILPFLILFLISGNIKNAYVDIYNGYTKNYSNNIKARYQYLERNRNSKYVMLKIEPVKDYLIKTVDVNDRKDNTLVNFMYSRYYHIDSVAIK